MSKSDTNEAALAFLSNLLDEALRKAVDVYTNATTVAGVPKEIGEDAFSLIATVRAAQTELAEVKRGAEVAS